MRFLRKLWRKRLSVKEQIRLQFRDCFEDSIKSCSNQGLTGEPLIDSLMIYGAIATMYDSLKNTDRFKLFSFSCMYKHNFDPAIILDEELERALNIYCPSMANSSVKDLPEEDEC